MMSAQNLLKFIDLASLNDKDDAKAIIALCQKAQTPQGPVAAVCVYPQFVKLAKEQLQATPIRVTTVANFPGGDQASEQVLESVATSLLDGSDEIDLVIPYKAYLNGDRDKLRQLIKASKALCGQRLLKVILETGALQTQVAIRSASRDALAAGADMLKTSTGKIAINATPDAVEEMLRCIKDEKPTAGLKVSGGIQTLDQAMAYIQLAEKWMGDDWLTPQHFRIGASGLLDDLLAPH